MNAIVDHIDHHNQSSSSSSSSSLTCLDIAEFSFDSHPTCYVDSGICHIVSKDCLNFMSILSLLDMGDLVTSVEVGFLVTFKQVRNNFMLI